MCSFEMPSAFCLSSPHHTLCHHLCFRPGVLRCTWRVTRRQRVSWISCYIYASLISVNTVNDINCVYWTGLHMKTTERHEDRKLLMFLYALGHSIVQDADITCNFGHYPSSCHLFKNTTFRKLEFVFVFRWTLLSWIQQTDLVCLRTTTVSKWTKSLHLIF
jgi:hypothetical protein